MAKPTEVRRVRLAITVDVDTWRKLRDRAEVERETQYRGRASVNALVNRMITECLGRRGGK
jgi:hypothetical protein